MSSMKVVKTVLISLAVSLAGFVAVSGLLLAHYGFSARDAPSSLEAFVARRMRSMAVPSRAKSMKNPVANTAANLSEARAHWADHCAICHGNNGSGDTEIGRNLYPKPPDMRLPATQNLPDGEIYYAINNGIRLTGMPAWGQAGEHDDVSWKLVHFIRHLPQLTPEEERDMKNMNPKSVEELKEEQEEEQFLNEGQPNHRAEEPKHEHH